jgi:hypothetical protein
VLTGAWAVVERLRDCGKERRWLRLGVKAKWSARELRREVKWCGEARGWCSPFIGARLAQEAVARE